MRDGIIEKMEEIRCGDSVKKVNKQKHVLLINVYRKDDPQKKILVDHIWMSASKQFLALNLRKGEKVAFNGRIKPYQKGNKIDWQCSMPTKVSKIIVSNDRLVGKKRSYPQHSDNKKPPIKRRRFDDSAKLSRCCRCYGRHHMDECRSTVWCVVCGRKGRDLNSCKHLPPTR